MGKSTKINWKTIDVNDTRLRNEGLIAVEECTDYNLINTNEPHPNRKRKLKDLKPARKKTKPQDEEFVVTEALSPSKSGCSTETSAEVADRFIAWNQFGIPNSILKAIQKQGFTEPTRIQSLTLPAAILGHKDIIGASETGSGKTLAFGLPMLTGIVNEKLKTPNEGRLYGLVLTPTRELAIQVKNHLVAAAQFTGIHIAVVVGGMAAVKQERLLNKRPEVVVATPGRLWELVQQGNQHLSQIDDIRYLVIDETDRMLERGHFEELHDILERINLDETRKRNRQNFVFSATLTLIHDLPQYLSVKLKRSKVMTSEQKLHRIVNLLGITEPKIVDLGDGISATLTESRITCTFDEKDYYVYYFLQRYPGRTLIFCNSIGCVKRLANLLGILQCRPLPLHASMQQRQRLKNLDRFREDSKGVLVATDVAARGLDIPRVQHVLHYQTPRTGESYVHRSGRTARATLEGLTLVLMEPSELQSYVKLCRTLKKEEDLPVFPVEANFLHAIKQRVNLAREVDRLDVEIRKSKSESGWLKKAAEDMDMLVDEFIPKYDSGDMEAKKKLATLKRKELTALLAKPVFPAGFSGKYFLGRDSPPAFQNNNKAIDVVKNSINNTPKRKNQMPLYKPKRHRFKSDKP